MIPYADQTVRFGSGHASKAEREAPLQITISHVLTVKIWMA